LEVAPDNAIVSIVSDSYDIYNTVDNIFGKELKDKIRARSGSSIGNSIKSKNIPLIKVRRSDEKNT